MAQTTKCQTPDAQFHTEITSTFVSVRVDFNKTIPLDDEEAELLEVNLHNVIELVLARYYTSNA